VSVSPAIFEHSVEFDPTRDVESFLKDVPARWVVYLMTDEADRPVQLLCVKNLRYSLKRRLTEDPTAGPSRRIDYRQIVRHVYWRRVYSSFEADWVYLEAARQFFPRSYRCMTGFQPAWFIHVDPDATFPRYTKTIDLDVASGELIGPVENKQSASKLIEDTLDWFDLCRYHNILLETPNAKACAYKEMGKCPAPCDGTISMENYRELVRWSAQTIVAPDELIQDNSRRMKAAAAELKFEVAAKIKAYVDSLSQLGKGPYRHVRPLRAFKFVSIQRGPRDNTAKVFLITPGEIEEVLALIDGPQKSEGIINFVAELAATRRVESLDQAGAERIGVVSHHLFEPKATHGAFVPLDELDENSIIKAFRNVQKQRTDDTAEDYEGVVKELQAQ
jgi:excinuclease UvrABC nuclease subunit